MALTLNGACKPGVYSNTVNTKRLKSYDFYESTLTFNKPSYYQATKRAHSIRSSPSYSPNGCEYSASSPSTFFGHKLNRDTKNKKYPFKNSSKRIATSSTASDESDPKTKNPEIPDIIIKNDDDDQKPDALKSDILSRIESGEFTVAPKKVDRLLGLRKILAASGLGRLVAKILADRERDSQKNFRSKMPEARGDVRAIIGQPFFIPLYSLFLVYGGVFRLSFGPKQFAIVSDSTVAKHILKDNARSYSKGILSEILEFVMGNGLIPADGEIWRVRRRAIVPALHKKYVTAMISLFTQCTQRLCDKIERKIEKGQTMEMESLFSRMTLDVIGKAVFNYDFDSLSIDKGITEAVYVTLREAEVRSTAPFPYWNIFPIQLIFPRFRKLNKALQLINTTLDELIDTCKRMVEEDNEMFEEEYVNTRDPSILRFLLASGDEVTSKQLRDDLMTMLIAGHETSAAVLTWTFYLLAQNPQVTAKLEEEVDEVLGDRFPQIEDLRKLQYTYKVIHESMRLYPQPPVLIRRALQDDQIGGYDIKEGQDIFISIWNLHRDPKTWRDVESFIPERWDDVGSSHSDMSEKFSYLPFGGGVRKCVGDQFATFELLTSIAMLVRRFRFELAPDAPPVSMTTGATIHTTNGLFMKAKLRDGSSKPSASEIIVKVPSKTDSEIVSSSMSH